MDEPKRVAPQPRHRAHQAVRRWVLLTALAIVVIGVLVPASVTVVWDGRFDLRLEVVSENGKRAQSLYYATEDRREVAELIAQNPKTDVEATFRAAREDNDAFVAQIPCSGRKNRVGLENSYHEPRFVVVRVRYEDGAEVRRVAEIPVGRGKRSVTIEIP
jgi:hypothetical protein